MREAVPYAVGVALSPIPIAAVLLLLTCRHAVANGLSFLGGWVVGVTVPTALLVFLVEQAGVTDSDPVWLAVAELAIGAIFLLAAVVVWSRRHRHAQRELPWVESVDHITSGRSAGLGVVLSGANPKVVALSLGAALALAESGAGAGRAVEGVALFTAIGAFGVSVPLALYLATPSRADSALRRLRAWLGRHESAVLAVVGVLLGVLFVRDGLTGL